MPGRLTLRLTEQQHAALRARAESEGASMQEVARRAIDHYLATTSRRARLDGILDTELARYADALDRLGQ